MNIKEKAKQFAIAAHNGQRRKNEPEKPMIIHPISVGMLLEEFGYDDEIVAAGYLHDIVEDTKYTIEDVEREFGLRIANLVRGASEPDKSLSWEERKQHTIEEIKKLALENKVVVCADKINNLEDLMIKFQKTGERDFSLFKRGEKAQEWYYTEVYNSLVANENEDLPIFKRLKDVLDIIFRNKKDPLLESVFAIDIDYYARLIRLHASKIEIKRMHQLCSLDKPFVIEFCGTPRTGKTTIINNLYDFFKKGGFSVSLIEELTTSSYYKEILWQKIKDMPIGERNIAIIEETAKQLYEAVSGNSDIIFIDRSLNDRAIWNRTRFNKGDMSEEQYNETTKRYGDISRELIDVLVIGYTDPLTSIQRDYLNSLALESRRFLNLQNIDEYNQSMMALMPEFNQMVGEVYFIDTTKTSPRDSAIIVAENIMSLMREQYVKKINSIY